MSDAALRLERYLHDQIPISRAMDVRVLRVDADGVLLTASLGPNLNHRATFFGGSAASLATLAGWALAHERLLALEGLDAHLVIQRSGMEYLEPATDSIEAECRTPPDEAWERLFRAVRRRGKGRIELDVELRAGGTVVGAFRGAFVAVRGG